MAEEFEATLLIACDDPESVFREIVEAGGIDSYRTGAPRRIVVHDRYFDTPEGSLEKGRCALRLRNDGEREILCFKGGETVCDWGGVRRLEIEGPWPGKILMEIADQGGALSCLRKAAGQDNPVTALLGCGMRIIQSRQTSRTLLDVFSAEDPASPALAELALDRVCYETSGTALLHFEIEIEAVMEQASSHLERLVSILRSSYPESLRPWNHNKLVTGFAIEAMVKDGRLSRGSGQDRAIPISWYDAMDEWIRRGSR